MKELSLENKIYLCKYHDIDTSLPTTLNLTVKEINKVLAQLKRDGLYEQFRNLTEKEYGDIPKGHKIIFADGNKRNFELENLILVTDSEALLMNSNKLIFEDAELTKAGCLVAKIMDRRNKLIKQKIK